MRIAVLTSSRADFGIYRPLLRRIEEDSDLFLVLIVFGTHLSPDHGYTMSEISDLDFSEVIEVETVLPGDSPHTVSSSMATTSKKFADLWGDLAANLSLIVCLGDRYEMFAAVSSSIPFNLSIAHIHGGEVTLGAIDNKFRNSLTQLSDYHFVATEEYYTNVVRMTGGNQDNVFYIGSLSLDELEDMDLLNIAQFKNRFGIDLTSPTILTTFHPETVSLAKNGFFAEQIAKAFSSWDEFQYIVTLPNADTEADAIRTRFVNLAEEHDNIFVFDHLGKLGYFSCMSHCSFMVGNTSSGIIEAPSFGKYVLNLGDRQKGRARNSNIVDSTIDATEIVEGMGHVSKLGSWTGGNIYLKSGAAREMHLILRKICGVNG